MNSYQEKSTTYIISRKGVIKKQVNGRCQNLVPNDNTQVSAVQQRTFMLSRGI